VTITVREIAAVLRLLRQHRKRLHLLQDAVEHAYVHTPLAKLLGSAKIFVLQWHRDSHSAIASTPSSGALRSEVDPEYGEEGAL